LAALINQFLLLSSIQSLKDSNLLLQETVQTMADKVTRRDATVEKLNQVPSIKPFHPGWIRTCDSIFMSHANLV
jgi:hypothetical protein